MIERKLSHKYMLKRENKVANNHWDMRLPWRVKKTNYTVDRITENIHTMELIINKSCACEMKSCFNAFSVLLTKIILKL